MRWSHVTSLQLVHFKNISLQYLEHAGGTSGQSEIFVLTALTASNFDSECSAPYINHEDVRAIRNERDLYVRNALRNRLAVAGEACTISITCWAYLSSNNCVRFLDLFVD